MKTYYSDWSMTQIDEQLIRTTKINDFKKRLVCFIASENFCSIYIWLTMTSINL